MLLTLCEPGGNFSLGKLFPYRLTSSRQRERWAGLSCILRRGRSSGLVHHVLNAVACFCNAVLVLWTLRCREGIRVWMSIHSGVHFPSMTPSHMEVKAGAWEEWTLTHFLSPSRAQTEHHFSGEKTFISENSFFWKEEAFNTQRMC